MKSLIEKAAAQRARVHNTSIEDAYEIVKDFPEEQLLKIEKSYDEHQVLVDYVDSLYARFTKGITVKQNIKNFKPEIDSKYNFIAILNQIRTKYDDLNVIF